jgi:hypothetical protein
VLLSPMDAKGAEEVGAPVWDLPLLNGVGSDDA